uniref:Glucose-6-phosphate 1-dehydrogenase n=1 Tax=Caenorhabditis japonica TaxID=281687 RepID=A0A8R1HSS9_CAEJA
MMNDYRRHSVSAPLSKDLVECLRESMQRDLKFETPYVFVVFGASGDLAKKKIYPTLWWLFRDNLLPLNIKFVGYARSDLTVPRLREAFEKYCKVRDSEKPAFEEFIKKCTYIQGKYDTSEGFQRLQSHIDSIQKESNNQAVNRLYYLALPPSVFNVVSTELKNNCMDHGDSWTRVIIEKPFGHDLKSSCELSNHLAKLFKEDQIYRIDHYLGKEMVQNLMVMRFGNRILAPSWNRDHIASVMISFKEDFGTGGRAGYFDTAGIIRDVMQNHLMQILTLVAMEKPASLNAEDIRDEKVKVLKATKVVELKDIVVGQYVANAECNHPEASQGYKDDKSVPADSNTPTYALAVLHINNERWEGVPFFLRCGKETLKHTSPLEDPAKPPRTLIETSRTIRRRLTENGLHGRRPVKKPLISEKNRKARVAWAKAHVNWGRREWANHVWSDESKFNLFGTDGIKGVRRPVGSRFDPKYQCPTVKHGGGSCMVWGCFSDTSMGPLIIMHLFI